VAAPKDDMNVQMIGPKRPKLSLHYGRAQHALSQRSSTLSRDQLRRIVAEMVG
jgi:hypothetical protein